MACIDQMCRFLRSCKTSAAGQGNAEGDLSEILCTGHNLREEEMTQPSESGLIAQLSKHVMERALAGELLHHLGYGKGEAPPEEADPQEEGSGGVNTRNGYSKKRVITGESEMEIAVPRDRQGSFDPLLIRKGQRRFEEFDERIIAMYGRGMTVREIQGFLSAQYQVEVSADFISTVTDSVVEAVIEWQNRPLERMYPIVHFDAFG